MDPHPLDLIPTDPKNFWKELLQLIIISLVIVIPFRLFIAQPFIVEGASMDPAFETGDYLIVDELTYRFRDPERGDVLVFKYPISPNKSFIKRIIGLPGETISIESGVVTITSSKYPDGLTLEESYVEFKKVETLDFSLGEGEYFVMGDNRLRSADSRTWGSVPRKFVVGRPIIRVLPFDFFPGQVSYTNEMKDNLEP